MVEGLAEHSVERRGASRPPLAGERAGAAIGAMVAAAFGLNIDDLASQQRGSAEIAFARQVAMYLAHTHLRMPLTEAGRVFHRDRTTVRHACQQVEDRRDDPCVDRLVECLERGIDLAADIARLRTGGRSRG